jgi:hypothetical protein
MTDELKVQFPDFKLMNTKLKAAEQKILGDLGELAVIKLLGPNSKNLNEIRNNFPLFDILEESKFYSVKTRRKFTPKEGKLNGEYNIVKPGQNAQKLKSFYTAVKELNINPEIENLYWVAIPYEDDTWCPVYCGRFTELPNNPVTEFFEGVEVYIRIKMKEKYTVNYNIIGYAKLDLVNNSVDVKHNERITDKGWATPGIQIKQHFGVEE